MKETDYINNWTGLYNEMYRIQAKGGFEFMQMNGVATKKKSRLGAALNYMNNNKYLYLMLILPITYFLVFCYLPMAGIVIAFKDYNMFNGLFAGKWVGFSVFKEIFQMQDFWDAFRNTLVLNILSLAVTFPAPIILALMINEVKNVLFKRVVQSIVYLPYFLSWMIIGGMMVTVLSENHGVINNLIASVGGHRVPFLSNNGWWIFSFVGALVWQSTGYNSIIYLAAITGVNPELYEAAKMDGCSRFQQVLHVTIPCIRQTMVIMFVLGVGGIMGIGFERAYALQNPIVMKVADVISTYVYRVGLTNARYSVATAVNLFQSVLGLILITSANFVAKKFGEEGLW